MLKSLILPVIVSLIVWFAQDRLKDVPNITFAVSEAIEIIGAQGNSEYAQEISVLNPGRSEVKRVSIKVPRHISSYKLAKHSSSIKEESFSENDNFELIYPELPAGQKIRLLVRYSGIPIEKSLISVSHAGGSAQPLENSSNMPNYLWVLLAFWLGLAFSFVLEMRAMQERWFIRWETEVSLFRDKKPWYATLKTWPETQFDAIERWLNKYSFSRLGETPAYKLLNRSKPALLSEENWSLLKKQATQSLEVFFSREITQYQTKNRLIELLNLKKPNELPLQSWDDFRAAVQKRLVSILLPEYMTEDNFILLLDVSHTTLDNIPEALADEIRSMARERYFSFLWKAASENYPDPSTILKKSRFELLTPDQSRRLKGYLLRLGKLFSMPDSFHINELRIFSHSEKSEFITDAEFEEICEYVKEVDGMTEEREKLRERDVALRTAELETGTLKARVLTQLNFIDKVLKDPTTVEKVEAYDQTFAPGNRKNLELVGKYLQSISPNK